MPAAVPATLSLEALVELSDLHPADTQHVTNIARLRQLIDVSVEENTGKGTSRGPLIHNFNGAGVVCPPALVGRFEEAYYSHHVGCFVAGSQVPQPRVGVGFSVG